MCFVICESKLGYLLTALGSKNVKKIGASFHEQIIFYNNDLGGSLVATCLLANCQWLRGGSVAVPIWTLNIPCHHHVRLATTHHPAHQPTSNLFPGLTMIGLSGGGRRRVIRGGEGSK
jgi:hypothetical protein